MYLNISDAAIKSVVEPEFNQTIQTDHLGATSDRGSVKEGYLDHQKDFSHETNFKRRLTHQRIPETWNFKKNFMDQEVMDFTICSFSSPSSCKYQPLEVDFSPTMKRHSPESIMGLKKSFLSFQEARNQFSKTGQTSSALA